jgi:radical SAM superfamily enzyme
MNKIIILSDNRYGFQSTKKIESWFNKNAAALRLSNQLRKRNIYVKNVFHFLNFDILEFDSILEKISENKKYKIILCVCTSFIAVPWNTQMHLSSDLNTTFFSEDFEKIFNFCLLAKHKYNSSIIFGGWGVTENSILNYKKFKGLIDLFVEGDGVEILTKMYNTNYNIDKNFGQFKKTEVGLLYKSNSIKDFSDQSSLPISEDYINEGEALTTELASGCIFSCSFCDYKSLGKKKNEFMRSYDSLKKEIEYNYKTFGTRVYTFTDNIVNDNKEKLEMLIKIKDELKLDLRWVGYVRLDTIKNKEQAQLLKDSGLAGATMGIESLYKTTGPYIGKMTDGEIIKDKLQMCREIWKNDVIVTAAMIAGLPTETQEILIKNYEFLISKEGKNLIDTFVYTCLILYENQGTKNDINAKRMNGDPFKDYIKNSNMNWVSPWGTSTEYINLVKKFNKESKLGAFMLPGKHNVIDTIEKHILDIRTQNINVSWIKLYNIHRLNKINEYKKKILET